MNIGQGWSSSDSPETENDQPAPRQYTIEDILSLSVGGFTEDLPASSVSSVTATCTNVHLIHSVLHMQIMPTTEKVTEDIPVSSVSDVTEDLPFSVGMI